MKVSEILEMPENQEAIAEWREGLVTRKYRLDGRKHAIVMRSDNNLLVLSREPEEYYEDVYSKALMDNVFLVMDYDSEYDERNFSKEDIDFHLLFGVAQAIDQRTWKYSR